MAQFYLSMLKKYNLHTKNIWPEIYISPDMLKKAATLLREEKISLDWPFISLQPFSLWQYKGSDIKKFSQKINWIGPKYQIPIINTSSPDERGEG